MLTSIEEENVHKRLVLPIPTPIPRIGSNGFPILKHGNPMFDVKLTGSDHIMCKKSHVTHDFVQKYIIEKGRAKSVALAVFFALASTTSWAKAHVLIDQNGNAILDSKGYGKACIVTYGNRTATRTLADLKATTDYSYGAIQKALTFWVNEGVMKELKSFPNQRPTKILKANGRPEKSFRFEINPRYLWNGPNFLGAALDYLQNLEGIKIKRSDGQS